MSTETGVTDTGATDTESRLGEDLRIDADLRLRLGDEVVTVTGYGRTVVVDAPTLRVARRLQRANRQWPIRRLLDGLAASGATLDVRVRGVSVAGFDRYSHPGGSARLLGVAPATLYPEGVLLAALRRRAR
ncbi:hypothetical protein [Haloarchaeobius sp. DFWS5]|uniref:hypothetical protein n=1 Tax=Haloarchaeobius sp. DFWS5 TaxID=3446114 RepID=UPI003EBF504B